MATMDSTNKKPSDAQVLGVVSFYLVAAILMVTVNKWVLTSAQLPVLLIFCQLAIAVILLGVCHQLKFLTIPRWNPATVKALRPLIAVNVLGLVSNSLCLQYVDASFYQVARGLVLPITVAAAVITKQGVPSRDAMACCAFITCGFVVGAVFDQHSTAKVGSSTSSALGIFFGVFSSVTTAIHAIVIKKSLAHVDNSTIQLAWYTNLISMIILIPVIPLAGEISGLIDMLFNWEQLERFCWGTAITGVFGFLICIAGFLSIKVTSPVTHMVSSAARGVIQTMISVWAFGDRITSARTLSIIIITAGSMSYVWIKNQEQQTPVASTASYLPVREDSREKLLPLTKEEV